MQGAHNRQWPQYEYIGPALTDPRGRDEKYIHGQNATPSLRNIELPDPHESDTNDDILCRIGRISGGVIIKLDDEDAVDLYGTDAGIIEAFQGSIAELAQRRFQAFSQQLVLAYNSGHYYRIGKTVSQPESAQTRVITNAAGTKRHVIKMDASHNTSIPCLEVCKGNEWEAYKLRLLQNTRAPAPTFYRFMEKSDAYAMWNSGLEMPKRFNTSVDNTIDLGREGLRNYGIRLINESSQADITPEEGLKRFGREFLRILRREHGRAEAKGLEGKALGLQLYIDEAEAILESLENNEDAFATLLSMRFLQQENENVQARLYAMRYRAIQYNTSKQSEIMQKIAAVKARVLDSLNRTPPYADEAFHELLKEAMPSGTDAQRVSKLLSLPYELRVDRTRAGHIARAKPVIEAALVYTHTQGRLRVHASGSQLIRDLGREISQMMATMRVNEVERRVEVLTDLRKMRNLSQRELSGKMRRLTGDVACSQSTISRIETGQRNITTTEANWYATAFNVDRVLFVPNFFSE